MRDALARCCAGANSDLVAHRLLRHAELVRQWNRRGNLVSSRDAGRVVERHTVESIEAAPRVMSLKPDSILDIGSGGGFPGIPMAILLPGVTTVLLESRRLRALFLLQTIQDLGLESAFAWCARAESLAKRVSSGLEMGPGSGPERPWSRSSTDPPARFAPFALATSRAVAPLKTVALWAAPLVREGGHLLAFKGSRAGEELQIWRTEPGPWLLAGAETTLQGGNWILLEKAGSDVSRGTSAPGAP